MRALLIALSLPLVVAAVAAPNKPASNRITVAKEICQPMGPTRAQDGVLDDTRKAPSRKLDDLPPAKQQLAVIRTLDGCDVPTVIRENIGGQ